MGGEAYWGRLVARRRSVSLLWRDMPSTLERNFVRATFPYSTQETSLEKFQRRYGCIILTVTRLMKSDCFLYSGAPSGLVKEFFCVDSSTSLCFIRYRRKKRRSPPVGRDSCVAHGWFSPSAPSSIRNCPFHLWPASHLVAHAVRYSCQSTTSRKSLARSV